MKNSKKIFLIVITIYLFITYYLIALTYNQYIDQNKDNFIQRSEKLFNKLEENLKVESIHGSTQVLGISEKLFIDVINGKQPNDYAPALELAKKIKDYYNVDLVYCLNKMGTCVLSTSIKNTQTNITGKNFSFRDYFKKAIEGTNYFSMHLGTVTKKRGFYYSSPVYDNNSNSRIPIGVLVIKMNVDRIDEFIKSADNRSNIYLISNNNTIISSNDISSVYKYFHVTNSGYLSFDTNKEFLPDQILFNNSTPRKFPIKLVSMNNKNYYLFLKPLKNYSYHTVNTLSPYFAVTIATNKWLIDFFSSNNFFILSVILILAFILLVIIVNRVRERVIFQNKLLVSENNYKTIFNSTNELIVIFDKKTKSFVDVNNYSKTICGYNQKEFLNINLDIFNSPPPFTKDDFLTLLGKISDNAKKTIQWKIKHKDNTYIWVEIIISYALISNMESLLLNIQDINEKKYAEQSEKNDTQQTSQIEKLNAVAKTATGIIKLIENPNVFISNNISSLKYQTDILLEILRLYREKETSPLKDEVTDKIEKLYSDENICSYYTNIPKIYKETIKQVKLINKSCQNLKNFSDKKQTISKININDLITELINKKDEFKNMQIEKNLKQLNLLNCNKEQLEFAISNIFLLLSKLSSSAPSIKVTTNQINKNIILQLTHTGEIISELDLKEIFEPFSEITYSIENTGINLLLSYYFIILNKGYLEISKNKDDGITFIVTFS